MYILIKFFTIAYRYKPTGAKIMTINILNKMWNVKDLLNISSTKTVKNLVSEYLKDPNCRPYDWIIGEKISEIEKASFIYSVLN